MRILLHITPLTRCDAQNGIKNVKYFPPELCSLPVIMMKNDVSRSYKQCLPMIMFTKCKLLNVLCTFVNNDLPTIVPLLSTFTDP